MWRYNSFLSLDLLLQLVIFFGFLLAIIRFVLILIMSLHPNSIYLVQLFSQNCLVCISVTKSYTWVWCLLVALDGHLVEDGNGWERGDMIVFVTGWRHDAQISGDSLCVIFVKLSVILLPQSSPIFSSLRSINTPVNNQEILTNMRMCKCRGIYGGSDAL